MGVHQRVTQQIMGCPYQQSEFISLEQRKHLVEAWEKKHGKLTPDDDVFPMFLATFGYKDTKSIKPADFDAMMAAV